MDGSATEGTVQQGEGPSKVFWRLAGGLGILATSSFSILPCHHAPHGLLAVRSGHSVFEMKLGSAAVGRC